PDERIVTIEDAAELQLQQEHVIPLESKPANMEGRGEVAIRSLVRNALRMRPDRIVIGAVRGGETLDMLQAMNTGHDGSITTAHTSRPGCAREQWSKSQPRVTTSPATSSGRRTRDERSGIHVRTILVLVVVLLILGPSGSEEDEDDEEDEDSGPHLNA